jgi:hypothetical protein
MRCLLPTCPAVVTSPGRADATLLAEAPAAEGRGGAVKFESIGKEVFDEREAVLVTFMRK